MNQVWLKDFLDLHSSQTITNNKLVNIRGCNGSGKSTIPLAMKEQDPDTFELVWHNDGKDRVVATVFPNFNWLALGRYATKCGGMDAMKDTAEIKLAVRTLWGLNYNIIMEGIMASTVRQTYIDLFNNLIETMPQHRDITIYNITTPVEICLQRIQIRNGGKPIKEDLVEGKWKIVKNNALKFREAGFRSIEVDNSTFTKDTTLANFFNNIGDASIIKENVSTELHPELKHYEWYKQYKAPNADLKFHDLHFDKFWYFLHERMRIYEKRVLLKQPAPWTDDPILQHYKFTNVVRDMDKLSIYVRNHILSKIDEPVEDVELRKKSVLLNIMTFRLWTKIDTYDVIGFLDLADPDMLKNWEVSKQKLLQRRKDGIANFTGVFFINHLHSKECASTDNKTFNAIAMIDYWIRNIDTIYYNATVKCKSLVEQVAYFQSLPSIGWFNAYEFACDVAMVTRYCRNHLVEWTQDNGTNVGPGAERGINFIFINKGGMSDYECIVYLRSIWKQEMQSRGYYDDFVRCLPKELNGDIDLRVIEHCLCEVQKYIKALEGTGRPKIVFKPSTTDLDSLKC